MSIRSAIVVFVCFVLSGCGDEVGLDPPRLTDDIDWVVRINFSDHHLCTGIVLSEHWLLTAGHCVATALDPRVEVSHEVFGDRRVVYDGEAQLLTHPSYEDIGHLPHRWHDIALVGLRDGALDASQRARLGGIRCSLTAFSSGEHPLYYVGYGHLPEPDTGACSDQLGSKKRYDGFMVRGLLGPPFQNSLGIELEGRRDALCGGDSGAPLLFDLDGIPHAFAIFSGERFREAIFSGTLIGPKLNWLESASESSHAPLRCADLGGDAWECFERPSADSGE